MLQFEIHVAFRQGIKLPLRWHDTVELWGPGHVLLGTLSGATIKHLIEHHLAGAALAATMTREIETPAQPVTPQAVRKPLASVPFDRAALRAKRRSRRKA